MFQGTGQGTRAFVPEQKLVTIKAENELVLISFVSFKSWVLRDKSNYQ